MDADPRDAVIQELRAENAQLRGANGKLQAEVDALRELVNKLTDRIEQLEREAHRQAAPFRRKDKDRKPPGQHRSPGRPKGHPPAHREQPPQADDHVQVELQGCPHCGRAVTDVQACEQFIEDIPLARPRVTRLVTYTGTCPRCGEVRSTHPMQVSTAVGAAGTHLGRRALALAAWLNKHLGLTMRKTCRVLNDLLGLRITPGGLSQALDRVADRSEDTFSELVRGLRQQPAVYADETSWWVGGRGSWLWTFTSSDCTLYRVDASRGRDVILDMLGDGFGGVLTSDCLASYENLPYTMHKCYAHHLKAIAQAHEQQPTTYLEEVRALLKAAMVLDTLRADLPPPAWGQRRQHLEHRADALLSLPRRNSLEERVRLRLNKRRRWLFTFLDHAGVEATNNRAERALRPAVITRKLSCGNKTHRGKRTWEILASIAATCQQRGQDFVEWISPDLALAPALQPR
jgi:hypothetical protein